MDPYKVLGVRRDASDEEIKEAYYEKIKQAHPDTGGDTESFKRIHEAYEAILDEVNDGGHSRYNNSDNIGDRRRNQESKRKSGRAYSRSDLVYPSIIKYVGYDYLEDRDLEMNQDVFDRLNLQDDNKNYGQFRVKWNESVLEAAERTGHSWPFSCRGGACSNCAVKILDGDIDTPGHAILTSDLLDEGYRLSCIGRPLAPEVKLVYGVRDDDTIQELLLPPRD